MYKLCCPSKLMWEFAKKNLFLGCRRFLMTQVTVPAAEASEGCQH